VLSLHGFASRPEGQVFLTRWNEVADQEGFVVVYPQGTQFPVRWNSFPDSGWAAADDVLFLRDLVSEISRLASIDPRRIFVSGMSNGGAMTHLAACELADIFAAAGVVAGPAMDPSDGCRPSRAISVVGFYGTADPLVSYEGGNLAEHLPKWAGPQGASVQVIGAVEWAESWARRNGCDPKSEVIYSQGDTIGVSYPSCSDDSEVVLYTVEGGGHSWPGGPSIPYLGKTTHAVDASAAMWAFFQRHPMPDIP
jgi:polyhydroxybutyrate depolymerase